MPDVFEERCVAVANLPELIATTPHMIIEADTEDVFFKNELMKNIASELAKVQQLPFLPLLCSNGSSVNIEGVAEDVPEPFRKWIIGILFIEGVWGQDDVCVMPNSASANNTTREKYAYALLRGMKMMPLRRGQYHS